MLLNSEVHSIDMFYNPDGYFLLKDSYNPHSLYMNPNDKEYIYLLLLSLYLINSWVKTSRNRLLEGYKRFFSVYFVEEDKNDQLIQTMYRTYQTMMKNSSYLYYEV